MGNSEFDLPALERQAWNAGRKLGGKRALKLQQVWVTAVCCRWPASERRGAVTDDVRTREVRLRRSSGEADEHSRATGRGVGGAKGGGQGKADQQSTRLA